VSIIDSTVIDYPMIVAAEFWAEFWDGGRIRANSSSVPEFTLFSEKYSYCGNELGDKIQRKENWRPI
jgi:hypothetical protein